MKLYKDGAECEFTQSQVEGLKRLGWSERKPVKPKKPDPDKSGKDKTEK